MASKTFNISLPEDLVTKIDIVAKNNLTKMFYAHENIRKENYILTYKLNEFKNN